MALPAAGQLFVIPAGGEAEQHVKDTIARPVDRHLCETTLPPEVVTEARSGSGDGELYCWGAVPGGYNQRTWAAQVVFGFHVPSIDAPANLEPSSFRRVQLHRNTQAYRFVLHVCEFVAGQLLVDEGEGGYRFSDFTRYEKAMARRFEAFVRNFFAQEQTTYRLGRSEITWDAIIEDATHLPRLPHMQRDTTLVNNECCFVIETKYHQRPFDRSRWGERDVVKAATCISSSPTSRTAARGGCSRDAQGVLLYAAGFEPLPLRFVLQGHVVEVRVLNLAQPWQGIHQDLIAIVRMPSDGTSSASAVAPM